MEPTSNKSNKIIWAIVAIVIIILGGLVWKNKAPVTQYDNKTIKIGALLSLSGVLADWGENSKKGIELAVEDFKKDNPDTQVEVTYEDTRGDPKVAVSGFQRLLEINKVDGFIGPLMMGEVNSVIPLIQKNKIPVVTPAFAPLDTRPDLKNPLMAWMDPAVEVQRLAKYMLGKGLIKVAIIGSNDPWEKEGYDAFIKEFEKLGGTITAKETVETTATDVRTEISKIVSAKPEAIFVCTYYQFVNSLKALSTYKYPGERYSVEIDTYLAGETKGYSNGLQFIAPDFYTSDFVKRFNERFGQKPSIPAGQAYDNAAIILSMFEKYKTREGVIQAMHDFKEWDGVSGKIEITPENRTILPTALFELKDGEISRLQDLK